MKKLLLGDEAIAQGALDAGLSGVYAYPGTPSTEITEYIQMSPLAKERGVHSRWSTNEDSDGGSTGHVVHGKACFGLYEACRTERMCRSFCECGYDRNKWRSRRPCG